MEAERFQRKEYVSGGVVEIPTIGKQTPQEEASNKYVATIMAKYFGERIRLLPVGTMPRVTYPDAINLRNNNVLEIKSPKPSTASAKSSIQNAIKESARQGAEEVIVFLEKEVTRQSVYSGLKAALQNERGRKLKTVTIRFVDNSIKRYNVALLRMALTKKG